MLRKSINVGLAALFTLVLPFGFVLAQGGGSEPLPN
jgi:hypothetical protein